MLEMPSSAAFARIQRTQALQSWIMAGHVPSSAAYRPGSAANSGRPAGGLA